MRLYDYTLAPSPRRVRIFLHEKGLDIPLVQIDIGAGEQFSDTFKRINPSCEVPALELEDGTTLTQGGAICRYLEELHPEPPLFGRTPLERAHVTMWDHRIELEGFLAGAEMFRNKARSFKNRALTGPYDYPQIPELIERGRQRIAHFYDILNDRLAVSPYIAGDEFSMADITGIVCVDFALRGKVEIPADHRHLHHWYEKIAARPSMSA